MNIFVFYNYCYYYSYSYATATDTTTATTTTTTTTTTNTHLSLSSTHSWQGPYHRQRMSMWEGFAGHQVQCWGHQVHGGQRVQCCCCCEVGRASVAGAAERRLQLQSVQLYKHYSDHDWHNPVVDKFTSNILHVFSWIQARRRISTQAVWLHPLSHKIGPPLIRAGIWWNIVSKGSYRYSIVKFPDFFQFPLTCRNPVNITLRLIGLTSSCYNLRKTPPISVRQCGTRQHNGTSFCLVILN